MKRKKTVLFCILAVFMSFPGVAEGGGAEYWEVSSQGDFLRGELVGVSVTDEGELSVSPRTRKLIELKQSHVWSCAVDREGNLLIGTGHEGRLLKIDPLGKEIFSVAFEEMDVTALATDPSGAVFAATSPDGKVYRVSPTGEKSVFFDPPEKYVWSLVRAGDGTLYAGTGNRGIVYRIDPSGKGDVWVDSTELNITSMLPTAEGDLLLGTDPGGLVLRVDSRGKTSALFDAPEKEIRRLVHGENKTLFALGINERNSGGTPAAQSASPVPSSDGQVSVSVSFPGEDQATEPAGGSGATPPRTDASGRSSVVYKLEANAEPTALWTSDAVGATELQFLDGRLRLGSGNPGRLFELTPEGEATLVCQFGEDHVTGLVMGKSDLVVATSNLGAVYAVSKARGEDGQFTSRVFDARFSARWGKLTWTGSGSVSVQTRTGNTESPDMTWSGWSSELRDAGGGQIESPRARYLQVRISFREAARLKSVRIAYLPSNVAPTISSLTVLSPGIALLENPQPPIDPAVINAGLNPGTLGLAVGLPPRRVFQKGARSLQWQAEDRNGDQLTFKVFHRAAGEEAWRPFEGESPSPFFLINADVLPDGVYEFKVEASDALSNPASAALTGKRTTGPVEIDNTPPTVAVTEVGRSGGRVTCKAVVADGLSRLRRVEFTVDGIRWTPVFPDDGVLDEQTETFTMTIPEVGDGVPTCTVRAFDFGANVGSGKLKADAAGKRGDL